MQKTTEYGVSGMSLYVPPYRVGLEAWCQWTGAPWEKVRKVVGDSFRMCGPRQNTYTMAANAVLQLIRSYEIDPRRVGMLALGTESSTDNAAGAIIVRGMVDRALERLGMPRLSRALEVPEMKHACLGGMYALKSALRYVATDGAEKCAIVVSSDIAEYERGSTGEQTQGAGAVAMLVEQSPRLFAVDLRRAGSASDYRGPDFRKPAARHLMPDYATKTKRMSDFPVFSGRYSTYAYLDETASAFEAMLQRLDVTPAAYFERVEALFFHRPYQMMPLQAASFLYARALVSAKHPSLAALCAQAGVSLDALEAECGTTPDLYATVMDGGPEVDPYPVTSALAAVLRRDEAFTAFTRAKLSLGSNAVRGLGNLYCAALPAWLAAGFEDAAERGLALEGTEMAAVGYGSGDAAEALPIRPVRGYEVAARRIGFKRALEGAVDLTQAQYEALHDEHRLDETTQVEGGFVIARVGERYEPGFQDLGVEYYQYVE